MELHSRVSPWIAPGWYAAFCQGCFPNGVPFKDKIDRDAFAYEHNWRTSHYVDCIDGEVCQSRENVRTAKKNEWWGLAAFVRRVTATITTTIRSICSQDRHGETKS